MAARSQKQQTKHQPKHKQKPARASSKARGVKQERKAISTGEAVVIPLNQLERSPKNVRTVGGQKIEDLAASIAAEGLLHNLIVERIEGGKGAMFGVIAGGRRLKALQLLAKQKAIPNDQPIACRIVQATQATSSSLAENVIREPMHPADQYEAIRKLVDEGLSQTEIAGRLGITTAVVRDRLALARVAPEVLDTYRAGRIDLAQVMALTLTTDHDTQRQIVGRKHVPGDWEIRRLLTSEAVGSGDRRVRFVGVKAYEAAGGAVRRDLFAKNGDAAYFDDAGLLERLALEKLEPHAEGLRDQWAWVETRTSLEHAERAQFGRVPEVEVEPTAEQAAELARLDEAADTARKALRAHEEAAEEEGDEDAWQALYEASEAAEGACEALHSKLRRPDPELSGLAGAIVTLSHSGDVETLTGLVRPQDKARVKASKRATAGIATEPSQNSDPMPVRMGLSALRTAVVQDALAQNVGVALRSLAFALVQSTLQTGHGVESRGVHVRGTGTDSADLGRLCDQLDVSAAGQRNGERAGRWEQALPAGEEALWAWCMAADDATVSELLAYCTARTIDGVQRYPNSSDRLGALAAVLQIDMADHWHPTPGYFERVRKAETLAVFADASGKAPADLTKLKRDQLAQEAAKRLAGTRWLPPTLRAAV